MISFSKTQRGFVIGKFKDYYGNSCSIQKSSIVNPDCIWIGIDDPDPKIMCSRAEANNIKKLGENGWQPFHIPEDVLLSTRMHLTREQIKQLIPILQKFVDSGDL